MLKGKHLVTATAAVLLAGVASAIASTAPAAPYAYGELNVGDLTLSGVLGNPAVSILDSTVTGNSTANYTASAFSGASAAPGQNVFGQRLQAVSTIGGNAQISSATDTANVVSVPGLTAVPGMASATAHTSADVDLTPAGPTAVVLGFTGSNSLTAATTGPGESAGAQTAASLTVAQGGTTIAGATDTADTASVVGEPELTAVPGMASATAHTSADVDLAVTSATAVVLGFTGSNSLTAATTGPGESAGAQTAASLTVAQGGTTIASFAPDALNVSVSSTDGTGNSTFSSRPTSYSTGPLTLAPGDYRIQLLADVQQYTATIPEPASMVLLGAGLLRLGFVRRRQAAQAQS